ncbi:MFS family permease [Streptomyces canus]|uniref:MFS transporter n=1 Tax=unclassified Streptomyces TaxID=2593676 RepID=UPI000F646F0C|nr:MFS transporter [Streptomyces sp. RP5T]RRR81506.1 MFS transporter [Streptomyces sp. RP5T]
MVWWRVDQKAARKAEQRTARKTVPEDVAPESALARQDFRWYWLGQSVSVLGHQMAIFLFPTIAIVTFHASGLWVGALNAVGTAAYPVLGLFAGVLMDRRRRRPAMLLATVGTMLALAWIPFAAAVGTMGMADLCLAALAAGAFGVLYDVANQSHLPTLLPRAMLARANARLEVSTSLALLGSPALGGLLSQALSGTSALAVIAGSFLIPVMTLLRLRTPEPPAPPRRPGASLFAEMRAGVLALWRHPLLRPATVAAVIRNLANTAASTVSLLFAYRTLHFDPGTVGVLFTLVGLGGVGGAWTADRMLSRFGLGRTLIAASASGALWIAAPLALWLPALPTLVVVGAAASVWVPVWNATVTTLRQSVTRPDLLGRVHATSRTVNFCAIPLGALVGGALADLLGGAMGAAAGTGAALALAGVTALGAVAVLACSPLRSVRDIPGESGADGAK